MSARQVERFRQLTQGDGNCKCPIKLKDHLTSRVGVLVV
jgi:hypothetical protein